MSYEDRETPSKLVILISGPSGSGKSTLINRLLAEDPRISFSVSVTTRDRRDGEVDGEAYHFVSEENFDEHLAANSFLEWAEVYSKRYGTPLSEVSRIHGAGNDALFDLDSVGGRNLMAAMDDASEQNEVVSIFILPPEASALRQRLRGRGTDSEAVIEGRLRLVLDQSTGYRDYRYLIVNDDLEQAYGALRAIIIAERARRPRQESRAAAILETFDERERP
jgi:guanylate kinase